MFTFFIFFFALPQEYVNLVMNEDYDVAIQYCEEKIGRNKDAYQWKLEMGDIYYTKLLDFSKAATIYQDVVDNYKHKNGWSYYRLAQVLEILEDYLNSARMYEIVATRFRKSPLDSFSLSGVERCFKKNYQDYVATIDGYNITRLELDDRTGRGGQFARPDEKAVLEQMITERLIYASAVEHNITETEFFENNFGNRNRSLLLDEVRTYEVTSKATPTEKQMKKYYEENKEKYIVREQVMGREIVVESDSIAQMLLDSLTKDIAIFDTLAKLYSIEANGRNGGNMGIVYPGRRHATVDSIIFKTEVNALTGIVPYDGKFGIYYITSHKPEHYRDFEEVMKQIEPQVRTQNVEKEDEALTRRLRKKAKVEVFNDSIIAVLKDTTDQSGEITIARINGRRITWNAAVQRNEMMTPRFAMLDLSRPDKVQELLDIIFNEDLRLELAWREKYFLHDGYFIQFKDLMKTLMDQGLYQKVVLDAIVIDSAEVEKQYNERIEEFKMPESARVHEILLDSKETAEKVHVEVMAKPESFDSLAAEYSTAVSSVRGGETGLIRRGMMGEDYDKVLFSLKIGEISDVFSVKTGTWTIIKMVEHIPEHYRSLDEVRHIIESQMKRQQQGELATNFLAKIKEDADIQILLPEPEEEAPEPQAETEE